MNQHSDDLAVDRFAAAMKEKLALARAKGRGGWEQCDPANLSAMLHEHAAKGDPRDVANFCMFLWSLGQAITQCHKAPAVAQEPVAHYGIIDPDYARVFTQARCIAWQYGYACVMQGSFTRDLDLLMVPWTDQAKENREQLLKLIAMACDLRFSDGKKDVIQSKADFTEQPHGRTSCSLHFPKFGDRRWIDVSFFPVQTAPAVAVNEQMLEALKDLLEYTGFTGIYSEKASAAIAAAEKAKGGTA